MMTAANRADRRAVHGATLVGIVRWRHGLRSAAALLAVGALSSSVAVRPARALRPGQIETVSVNHNGHGGDRTSSGPAANGDGDVVAFYSDATNLVPGDSNQARDVFVRVRWAAITERVSVSSSGVQGNRASQGGGGAPGLSGDGNLVAFYSMATNLVPGDTNGQSDVFVRDRGAQTTEIVSLSTSAELGNGPSVFPSISEDGRFVAFQSLATNLIDGDTNGVADIFVRDRQTGITERACKDVVPNRGSSSPAISADGQYVAFASAAANLVPNDTNGKIDIFVCNRATGAIEMVSVSTAGVPGNGDSILPAISEDGGVVAFKSLADNLVPGDLNGVVDVYARDRSSGTTELISASDRGGDSNELNFPPSISGSGRFVAFGSFASNLTPGPADVVSNLYVRDRAIGETRYVDVNAAGELGDGGVPDILPAVSGDGKQIGFASAASNLVSGDRNAAQDVWRP